MFSRADIPGNGDSPESHPFLAKLQEGQRIKERYEVSQDTEDFARLQSLADELSPHSQGMPTVERGMLTDLFKFLSHANKRAQEVQQEVEQAARQAFKGPNRNYSKRKKPHTSRAAEEVESISALEENAQEQASQGVSGEDVLSALKITAGQYFTQTMEDVELRVPSLRNACEVFATAPAFESMVENALPALRKAMEEGLQQRVACALISVVGIFKDLTDEQRAVLLTFVNGHYPLDDEDPEVEDETLFEEYINSGGT